MILKWRKASRCEQGACTLVAFTADQVLVRDSKDPDGGALAFSRDEWSAFVAGVKAGEFDDPLGGADDSDFGLPAN